MGSSNEEGSGTAASSGRPCPGLVPHVTNGVSVEASISTTLSKTASSSVLSERQYSTAWSHASPSGACGRPFRYSNVVSSGAIMPALAPASIDMLQTVILPSMESLRTASPRYSTM